VNASFFFAVSYNVRIFFLKNYSWSFKIFKVLNGYFTHYHERYKKLIGYKRMLRFGYIELNWRVNINARK
jgi:hypothetical protein